MRKGIFRRVAIAATAIGMTALPLASIVATAEHAGALPASSNVVMIGGSTLSNDWSTWATDANNFSYTGGGYLPTDLGSFTFTPMTAASVSDASLAPFDTAVLNMASNDTACNAAVLGSGPGSPAQALVDFVAGGKKLIIYDSECWPGPVDYSWLPYPFATANPGAMGGTGTLTIVENNTLSSNDPLSPYFIDAVYLGGSTDAVGDMNVMTTMDPNWFVDMSGTNYLGITGPVHTYARYGTPGSMGLMIYNGMDQDYQPDTNLKAVWFNELNQPFNPDGLPGSVAIVGISLTPSSQQVPVGGMATVTAEVADLLGVPSPGTTVTFLVTSGPNAGATGTGLTDSNGKLTFSWSSAVSGIDTVVASFVNGQGQTIESSKATVEWTQAAVPDDTSVFLLGPASGTYSQPATIKVYLKDITAGTTVAGEFVDVTIGSGPTAQTLSVGPTDAGGEATAVLPQLLQPAPSVNVSVSFAGDTASTPQLNPSSNTGNIAISPDACSIAYSGDTLVAPLTLTSLKAQFSDANPPAGDLSGHSVTFSLSNSASPPVVSTYTALTDASGVAATSVPLLADTYLVHVSAAADNEYAGCESNAGTDPLITVAAAAAKATGGGWASNGVGRFNFGFNLIPQAGGVYTGEIQMTNNSNKNKFHGRVITSASQLSSTTETWSGTGFWNGQAASFTIKVTDGGKKADSINLVIKVGSTTVFTTSGSIPLKGGNITIH